MGRKCWKLFGPMKNRNKQGLGIKRRSWNFQWGGQERPRSEGKASVALERGERVSWRVLEEENPG